MGYFRVTQKQSGGGSGATITVSYSSSYAGNTITCTDGVTTYTATATSAGNTTFNVNAEGTWTITCNGTSKTVNVVLDYSVTLTITKTISVYSAANDTLSFTDAAGSKTVTTDSSGAGSVSITYDDGSAITFTSSVADDPSNIGVGYYSKAITFTAATTTVYVMPDGAVYWYGYMGGSQILSSTNSWGTSGSVSAFKNPTLNTNYVAANTSNTACYCGIGSTNKVSGSKVCAIIKGVTATGTYGNLWADTVKTLNQTSSQIVTSVDTASKKKYEISISADSYCAAYSSIGGTASSRASEIYALWCE